MQSKSNSVPVAAAVFFHRSWLVLPGKVTNMVLLPQELEVVPSFQEVVEVKPLPKALIVDAQISAGGPSAGFRAADQELAKYLGWPAAMMVSPALPKERKRSENEGHHLDAAARKSSAVTLAAPYHQRFLFSGHPELSFRLMAGRRLQYHPRTREGRDERAEILRDNFSESEFFLDSLSSEFPLFYVYNVLALLWSSRRASMKTIIQFPSTPTWDAEGRREQIVG